MSHSPEHAIREWLARFTGTRYPPGTEPSRMRPDTVRFVKRKDAPPGQISYIACDADGGSQGPEQWHWTVVASRDDEGSWSAHGVSGGSGGRCLRGRPWANLGGNWGRNGFRAGGTVEDAGAGIARVRLTDVEGRVFEDTVDEGVVLFSTDEPAAMPMRLELLDVEARLKDVDPEGVGDEFCFRA